MVIERSNLREEEKKAGSVEEEQMYYMQLAQMVIVVALILAVSVSFTFKHLLHFQNHFLIKWGCSVQLVIYSLP